MVSPIFTINNNTAGESLVVLFGDVITLRLASTSGVKQCAFEFEGTSASYVALPEIVHSGIPFGTTATFTVPAGFGTYGAAYRIKCTINNGLNGQRVEPSYVTYSAIYILSDNGTKPFLVGETFERNATHGIVQDLNERLALDSGGGGAPLGNVAPVPVTKATAVIGALSTAARSDHKHDVSTASGVSVGAANAEGSATSLARSDHTHAVTDLKISGQSDGYTLRFNGTNWINAAPNVLNKTVYVDASFSGTFKNGSGSNPFSTLAAAIASLTSGVILVAPGTYAESSLAIPKGKSITIRALSTSGSAITSLTNQIVWTVGNNDELHLIGVDCPGGVAIKDGDAGTGNVLLTLESLACGAITNGNAASAAHTHIIGLNAVGRSLTANNLSNLSDLVINGFNINGQASVTKGTVTGNTTCGYLIGYNVYFGDSTTHTTSFAFLTDACEFGLSVTIALTGTGGVLYVDDSTNYYVVNTPVSLTGTGTVKTLLNVALPATNLNLTGQAQGDIAYYNGSSWVRLAAGLDGYVLTTHSTGQNPTWTPTAAIRKANNALQLVWYVDGATGNDANDGKTSVSALASMTELANRLCPNNEACILTGNMTINVAAGTYIRAFLSVTTYSASSNYSVTIQGAYTSSAPITLATVVAPNAPTVRGELTTASGTFVAGKRIRITSGTANGAIGYSTGLNGGATDTFFNEFVVPTIAGYHTPVSPSAGDTCVVDTLSPTKFFQSEFYGSNGALIVVKDCQIQRFLAGGDQLNTPSADGGGNVVYSGCELVSTVGVGGDSTAGGACLFGCRVVSGGNTNLVGHGWLLWGCVVEGILSLNGAIATSYGLVINGGQINVGTTAQGVTDSAPSSITFNASFNGAGALEIVNGPNANLYGQAVMVSPGSAIEFSGYAWGLAGTYAIGLYCESGGWAYVKQSGLISDWLKIPSTINCSLSGHSHTFASLPAYYPSMNCGIALSPDSGATAGLSFSGQAQGNVLYFNGTSWTLLAPGTDGYALLTHGAGSNPTWGQDMAANTLKLGNAAASAGTIRVPKDMSITARNAAGNGDIELIRMSSNGVLNIGRGLYGEPAPTSVAISSASSCQFDAKTNIYFTINGTTNCLLTTKNWDFQDSYLHGRVMHLAINSTPSNPGNGWNLYSDSGDNKLKAINSSGTIKVLSDPFSVSGQTRGDILFYDGTNWTRLAAGTDGYALTTKGSGVDPIWNQDLLARNITVNQVISALPTTTPTTPASGVKVYANSSGAICFKGSGGGSIIGDGSGEIQFNATNFGTNSFSFQCSGSDRLVIENGKLSLYVPQVTFKSPNALCTIVSGQSATSTCYGTKLQAQGSSASGTFTTGALELAGGDAIVSATGTVTGGNAIIRGGAGNTTASNGNVAIGADAANYQSMAGGVFIGVAGAIPGGNPTGGFFLFVDPADNKLKARGPSGTVTNVALP